MAADLDATHAAAVPGTPRPALRRAEDGRVLFGVCAGIARYFGWDPIAVRVAFVIAAAAGGVGVVIYALVALLVPAGASSGTVTARLAGRRAALEVAAGAGLLLLAALLALRATGVWFSDAIVWPLVLVTTGAALLWRGSDEAGPRPAPSGRRRRRRRARDAPRATPPTARRICRAPVSASRSSSPPASSSCRRSARSRRRAT